MKRLFDLVVAAAILVLASPLLAAVALLIWKNLGRPIFFTQERAGRDGRPFRMVKFRTMRNAVDDKGKPLPDDQRLTRFGQLLRSTSLDELPELINVVRGDMSLVGPRPLLMQYLPLYSAQQARRHQVLPGVTGWAQVNGRNALSWEEKFALDTWYVDNRSFLVDLRILAMTARKVVSREGVSAEHGATMAPFVGPRG